MRFSPLSALRDPRRRPRVVIAGFLALIAFVLVWAGSIIGTSTEWFCTTPCHKVHDDNTLAFKQSSHRNVSCIACHEPVNASPVVMTMMKIHVLPDLPATIFDTFELPPNDGSHLAAEMPTEQCTQCHNLGNRAVTPSRGIRIDHRAHEDAGVTCTTCHNRVAHPEEDITLVLDGNERHENWMAMDGCFRCHSLDADAKAPGRCDACHTKKFDLVPATHKADGWYERFGDSSGHARAAREESASVVRARDDVKRRTAGLEHAEELAALSAGSVNSCYTCHESSYCDRCHGTPMPHSESFAQAHSKKAYADPSLCGRCHARSAEEARGLGSCDACHHPAGKPGVRWTQRHASEVRKNGAEDCYRCHDERLCARCHVRIAPSLQ